MDFTSFIIDRALILIPVIWIIGAILKSTPIVPNWLIPWISLVAGIGGAIGLLGLNADAVIQGVLVTGAAVLGHQLIKHTNEGINTKDKHEGED